MRALQNLVPTNKKRQALAYQDGCCPHLPTTPFYQHLWGRPAAYRLAIQPLSPLINTVDARDDGSHHKTLFRMVNELFVLPINLALEQIGNPLDLLLANIRKSESSCKRFGSSRANAQLFQQIEQDCRVWVARLFQKLTLRIS